MLEVVVALVLLEVAVVGAVGTLAVASRTLAEAEHLERAVLEAEGVLDSLAGVPGAESGSRVYAGGRLEWLVDPGRDVVLTAVGSDGAVRFELHSALPSS